MVVKDYPITIPQEIRDALQDDRNVPEKLKKSYYDTNKLCRKSRRWENREIG